MQSRKQLKISQLNQRLAEQDLPLGERLMIFRNNRQLTQRDVAAEVGCSAASICRRETGKTGMTESELLELCSAAQRIVERRQRENTLADVLGGE